MKSHFETTRVLDHACKADVDACAVYLRRVARNLTSEANCAADYAKGNQMVVKAYVGMMAYQTVYRATCLRDQDTGSYCFANAVDSGSHDAYPYYLPLNLSLPGTAIPSCSECLQQTMAIYQTAAAVRDQPIATTYVSAALQINTICGPDFVSDTLPLPQADPLDSAGARLRQSPSAALAGVLGAAILFGWLL